MNKVLVIGMGKTGLSMARALKSAPQMLQCAGDNIYAADTRKEPPMAARMKKLLGKSRCYAGENFPGWPLGKLRGFDYVALSPSVPLPRKWKFLEKPGIISELGLFGMRENLDRFCPALLCVTGTNGKSTVAELTAALCRAAGMTAEVAGNSGEPLLDAAARWQKAEKDASGKLPAAGGGGIKISAAAGKTYPDVGVVELSSFQLALPGNIFAHAAAMLNVNPDHLDYHENFAEYAKAKARIYENAGNCIVNLDDPAAAAMSAGRRKIFSYARNAAAPHADWRLGEDYIDGCGMRFCRAKISPALSAENAAAALALFASLQQKIKTRGGNYKSPLLPKKLPQRKLAKVLAGFSGLPHRRQIAGKFGGVSYINDSKATNVASACFALNSAAGEIILIAGGDGKGQDFSPLAGACKRVKKAFLFGKDSAAVRRALLPGGVECEIVSGMKSAVAGAAKAAKKGGAVLLSPACSSLDMYKNYAERGEDFMREAKKHALP